MRLKEAKPNLKIGIPKDALPKLEPHKTGLMVLSSAFIDFVMEKVIRLIFDSEDSNYSTVASYAVIDLGFDILSSKNPNIFKPFKGKKINPNLLPPPKKLKCIIQR